MVTQNEIFTALQNGEDPQKIADAFVAALNAAIKQKEDADNSVQEKTNRAQKVLDAVWDLLKNDYPDLYSAELREVLTAEELVDIMDEAFDEAKKTVDPVMKVLGLDWSKPKTRAEIKKEMDEADPIMNFLKKNGLLN